MTDRDLTLVIALELDEDWHTYWWDAGSWGSPPRLQVDAPEGWHVGPMILPAPECISTELGPVYGYHGSVRFQVPLRRPDASPAELKYELDWLVCKEACLLGMQSNTLRVPAQLPNGNALDLQKDAHHLAPARGVYAPSFSVTRCGSNTPRVAWGRPSLFFGHWTRFLSAGPIRRSRMEDGCSHSIFAVKTSQKNAPSRSTVCSFFRMTKAARLMLFPPR